VGLPKRKTDKKYTYTNYISWPDDERWELINGVAWNMSPAPSRLHQDVFGSLFSKIFSFLEGGQCKVYGAPFDVLLPASDELEEGDVSSVVQPDISVICDRGKLTDKGCTGAPDWLIEILSPYTSKKDLNEKFFLYECRGVKEYWIIDPGNRFVHIYLLTQEGKYDNPLIFTELNSTLKSNVCPGFEIILGDIFSIS
jgi:Uma2 family endonuclease